MQLRRVVVISFVAATLLAIPCSAGQASEEKAEDVWSGEGPRPGARRARTFELTEEETARLIESLKKSNPEKAKEVEKLQETDKPRFYDELRRHAGDEYGTIVRERIDKWRAQRRDEFLAWLKKDYPRQAEELAKLKTKEEAYQKKYDLLRGTYWRIYEEEKRNPELATVLKADLELLDRRNSLLERFKRTKDKKEKDKVMGQLDEVVSRRFDLIVRKKQIAYEWLLDRIRQLQEQLHESRDEIKQWQDKDFKDGNVKERLKELINSNKFQWD